MISKGLYGKQYLDIQVREHEFAPAGDDRVIVKVHACGVCGTDLNFVGTGQTITWRSATRSRPRCWRSAGTSPLWRPATG